MDSTVRSQLRKALVVSDHLLPSGPKSILVYPTVLYSMFVLDVVVAMIIIQMDRDGRQGEAGMLSQAS